MPTTQSHNGWAKQLDKYIDAQFERMVQVRRHLHAYPELSGQEVQTTRYLGDRLSESQLSVQPGPNGCGLIVDFDHGPDATGRRIAIRADIDALAIQDAKSVDYRSRVAGVMHACGHDAHTAILMGVAELLTGMRERLPGSVVFVFQPAEEGAPGEEEGGAELMLAEGAFDDPVPQAVFGLHVTHRHEVGSIGYTEKGAMASSDRLTILVKGSQTHAAYPWRGVDPIAVAARMIPALHAIPAREVDTRIPSVVSFGAIHGGVRSNIIPGEVELLGTIRSLDPDMRFELHEKVRRTIAGIAASAGAEADVEIRLGYPITYNDPELTQRMLPTLRRVAGADRVKPVLPVTGAEDFSYYQERAPGLFFWLGVRSADAPAEKAAPNHSPRFHVDESGLVVGVRSLAQLTLDYMGTDPD